MRNLNKVAACGMSVLFALVLTACGGNAQETQTTSQNTSTKQEQTQRQETTAKKDFDGSKQSKVGEGEVILRTAAGTSENENVPKMTISKDTQLTQVEVDTKGLDGSAVTYIYVDGVEAQKGNMGDSQQSVTLQGDALKAGTHTIEVVQFKGDGTKGEVVFYRKVTFEIAN